MINVIIGDLEFSLIFVYFFTNADYRNGKVTIKIKTLSKFENKEVMVVGDFNGSYRHDWQPKLNKNSKIVLEFIINYNLNIINFEQAFNEIVTWSRGQYNSVADFALLNENLYLNNLYLYVSQ